MSRERILLFFFLTLVFVGVSSLFFSRVWNESRTRFRTGLPIPANILPDELRELGGLIPEGPPKAPAIRPTDPLLSGGDTSKVTIIVFGDFECQFCKNQAFALDDAVDRVGRTSVRVVWRDLPLVNQHAHAMSAASVGRCAHAQHQFRGMHNLLFEKATAFNETEFLAFARQLGLNEQDFLVCLRDPAIPFAISRDLEDARDLAITEVPLMFIQGSPIVGFVDADTLEAILKKELERATPPA